MVVRNSEKGALVAVLAIVLPVMLAIAGLVHDLGYMYAFQRHMQAAADAAAIAGIQEWKRNNYTTYQDSVREDAALNGFDGAGPATVEIHRPPTQGSKAGNLNFLEVVISQDAPMYFMSLFRDTPAEVKARAVAGMMPQDACLYALDPSRSGSLTIAGNARLTLHDCGAQINSSDSAAATTLGGALMSATGIAVVGDYSGSGFTPTPVSGATATPDPLADLPEPFVGACDYTGKVIVNLIRTLTPGVYCGGIEVRSLGVLTMLPGVYIMKGGGFKTTSGSTTIGAGVMIYNTEGGGYTWGPFDFHAASTNILAAPLLGTYKGILFFNDRNIVTTQQNFFAGTPLTTFTGVVYSPSVDGVFTGNTTTVALETMFIGKNFTFQGNTRVQIFNLGLNLLPPSLAAARIVE